MTRIGICAPMSAMKSKPPAPISGSSERAQNSRIWSSSASIFFGVNTRDMQRPVDGVRGRILEQERARGNLEARLDQLEDPASRRAVRVAVDEAALDVLVAAHGVEVVRLVVVERRLLAEAAEHRVRIGVDRDVVGVVVDVGLVDRGHAAAPLDVLTRSSPDPIGVSGDGTNVAAPSTVTRCAGSGTL